MSIILDHVFYTYNPGTTFEKHALQDVSLCIPDGEFIGLICHTGSGKSTLIQHLNGLVKATSGNIYYDGKDIYDKEFSMRELRRNVGLVFQYPEHQLFESSVSRDVLFGPENMGSTTLDAEMAAYSAIKSVGIDESLLDASPFDLSGGQKRRVAIAGILAMKPEVFILDEPTAGLDPKGSEEILTLIKNLQKDTGMTVILVSHSMEDVANYVDRILVMNKGELKMDGSPKDVFKKTEELSNMGLRAPEVTYIVRELRKRGLQVDDSAITVSEAKETILNALYHKKLNE